MQAFLLYNPATQAWMRFVDYTSNPGRLLSWWPAPANNAIPLDILAQIAMGKATLDRLDFTNFDVYSLTIQIEKIK